MSIHRESRLTALRHIRFIMQQGREAQGASQLYWKGAAQGAWETYKLLYRTSHKGA